MFCTPVTRPLVFCKGKLQQQSSGSTSQGRPNDCCSFVEKKQSLWNSLIRTIQYNGNLLAIITWILKDLIYCISKNITAFLFGNDVAFPSTHWTVGFYTLINTPAWTFTLTKFLFFSCKKIAENISRKHMKASSVRGQN